MRGAPGPWVGRPAGARRAGRLTLAFLCDCGRPPGGRRRSRHLSAAGVSWASGRRSHPGVSCTQTGNFGVLRTGVVSEASSSFAGRRVLVAGPQRGAPKRHGSRGRRRSHMGGRARRPARRGGRPRLGCRRQRAREQRTGAVQRAPAGPAPLPVRRCHVRCAWKPGIDPPTRVRATAPTVDPPVTAFGWRRRISAASRRWSSWRGIRMSTIATSWPSRTVAVSRTAPRGRGSRASRLDLFYLRVRHPGGCECVPQAAGAVRFARLNPRTQQISTGCPGGWRTQTDRGRRRRSRVLCV